MMRSIAAPGITSGTPCPRWFEPICGLAIRGYLHYQDHAGDPVREYIMHGGDPRAVLDAMKKLYAESKA